MRPSGESGGSTSVSSVSRRHLIMNAFTKDDWLVAEVLADESQSFILWMLDSQLCKERADFNRHFGEGFPINDVLDELAERGFLQENGEHLTLTDLGQLVVVTLQNETASPTLQLKELVDREAYSETVPAETINFSVTEEIWHCAAALSNDSEQEESLKEYRTLRLNVLLLMREGLHSILADNLARFCPQKYQRSLALMAIRKARLENASKAFTVAQAIIGQMIDPTVLGVSADLANELDRVKELEDAVMASERLDQLRKELDSERGAW